MPKPNDDVQKVIGMPLDDPALDGLPPELKERFGNIGKKMQTPEPAHFSSKDHKSRLLAFFLADTSEQEAVKDNLPGLCDELTGYAPEYAKKIIKSLTDKFISPQFDANSLTLTRIGIQLGLSGYDQDSLRCADRVDDLLAE